MIPMTQLIRAVLVAAFLAGSPLMAQSTKMAGVDLKRMFDDYWKTKQSNNQLKAQRDDIVKEGNSIVEKMKSAEGEYKKLLEAANDTAVSAEQREKSKKSAEDKLLELRQIQSTAEQFDRNARQTLAETEARMKNNILKELREAINARAKTGGYTMIVDVSAESAVATPVFLFNTLEDLTASLLAELNAKAPVGAFEEKKSEAPTMPPLPPPSSGEPKQPSSSSPLNLPSAGGKK